MVYKILLLSALLISSNYLQAQSITGRIVNANDETPMTGCVVESNRQHQAFADDEGNFSIRKTPDMQELVFMFIGMHSFKISIAEIEKDTTLGTFYMFQSPRHYYLKKGIATETYGNGQIRFFMNVRKTLAHGSYIEYYENGKKKVEGQYDKHYPTGLWTYYKKNGEVVKIEFEKGFYRAN